MIMSIMVSRDHSQSCRKLFGSSFGALVPLGPHYTSVVPLVGYLQQKQRHDGYVKPVWVWFAVLNCTQVCTGVCTGCCACSTRAVGDRTFASLSLKVLPC